MHIKNVKNEFIFSINNSDRAELVVDSPQANYAIHAYKGTSLPFGRHRAREGQKPSLVFYINNSMAKDKKMKNPCWKGYEAYGMKKKNGKEVPNCVPIKEELKQLTRQSIISTLVETKNTPKMKDGPGKGSQRPKSFGKGGKSGTEETQERRRGKEEAREGMYEEAEKPKKDEIKSVNPPNNVNPPRFKQYGRGRGSRGRGGYWLQGPNGPNDRVWSSNDDPDAYDKRRDGYYEESVYTKLKNSLIENYPGAHEDYERLARGPDIEIDADREEAQNKELADFHAMRTHVSPEDEMGMHDIFHKRLRPLQIALGQYDRTSPQAYKLQSQMYEAMREAQTELEVHTGGRVKELSRSDYQGTLSPEDRLRRIHQLHHIADEAYGTMRRQYLD